MPLNLVTGKGGCFDPDAIKCLTAAYEDACAELHVRLETMVGDAMRRSVRWPKAPNGLSNALRRMAMTLRAAGIDLQFSRSNEQGRRMVSVVPYAAQVRKDRQ